MTKKCIECDYEEAKFSDPRESLRGEHTLCKDCAEAAYIDEINEAEDGIRFLKQEAEKLQLNIS